MSAQNSPVEVDIAVVGGGLVGASLALALARSPRRWRVALVEGHAPNLNLAAEDSDWDARVYAISPANQQFLAQLDAWPAADRIGVIAAMDVRGDRTGKIAFSAQDAGEARLAYIAENRWMVAALWAQLAHTEVLCLTGERPTALVTSPKAAQLTFASGRALQAKLVIGAVGGGDPIAGFDFGNSPSSLQRADLTGRPVVMTTAAGVRGLQRYRPARRLYAASLVCARATAAAIRAAGADEVCFVITGEWVDRDGDEDVACADYIEALLSGESCDPAVFARRVRDSDFGRRFSAGTWPNLPLADLDLAAQADYFDFAMPVGRLGDRLVIR